MTNNEKSDLDRHPSAEPDASSGAIPVIDLGDIAGTDSRGVAEIASACRDWGFFQVVNHGVSADLVDSVWRQTRQFFAQPMQVRQAIMRTRDNPWGYYNRELTKNQRDKKQVFDFTLQGVDAIYAARNRWPESPRGFRETMLAYLDACTALSLRLLGAFCMGLDLAPDFLHSTFAPAHTGFVRLNHYPVEDPTASGGLADTRIADMGVHHHTDAGALTILLQDDTGGLQVYKDGYWHDVQPLPGAFVVNTGDMMQVWSNDRYQAAMHRVLAMQRHDRFSIPFFLNPAAATRIAPLPTVVSADRPARYRPIDWAGFRGRRTDGDFADYGTEVQIADYRLT